MRKPEAEIEGILITQEQIAERVRQLSQQITSDYAGNELFLVCILKGATIFWADLSRQIDLPLVSDFVAVSSYGNRTTSSGVVKFDFDLSHNIEGKEVLVIDDIVDTGRTIVYLQENFMTRQPASLKLCALLDKPSRREVEVSIDYLGFTVPDVFVVGYGLDFRQRFRNLPYIASIICK